MTTRAEANRLLADSILNLLKRYKSSSLVVGLIIRAIIKTAKINKDHDTAKELLKYLYKATYGKNTAGSREFQALVRQAAGKNGAFSIDGINIEDGFIPDSEPVINVQ